PAPPPGAAVGPYAQTQAPPPQSPQYGGAPVARCQMGHEIAPGASYCAQGHPIALDQMQFANDAYGGAQAYSPGTPGARRRPPRTSPRRDPLRADTRRPRSLVSGSRARRSRLIRRRRRRPARGTRRPRHLTEALRRVALRTPRLRSPDIRRRHRPDTAPRRRPPPPFSRGLHKRSRPPRSSAASWWPTAATPAATSGRSRGVGWGPAGSGG